MIRKPPFTAEYISRGADNRLQPEAQELAEQVFFMRDKLEEMRKELKDAPLVTEYDNGGQQRGTHINPAFKAYRDLMATYTKTLNALEAIIGKKDPGDGEDSLEALRKRFNISMPAIQINDEEPKKATGTDGKIESYWKVKKKMNPQKGNKNK